MGVSTACHFHKMIENLNFPSFNAFDLLRQLSIKLPKVERVYNKEVGKIRVISKSQRRY